VPSGSFCPVFADGFVWLTSTEHSLLSKVDPSNNRVLATIPVGRHSRFATAGAGSVWTLNQGDGTISRVDTKRGKLVASIPAGLSGHGGEITFGFRSVWVTLDRTPVTRIDAQSNSITRQWIGAGGDSIRAGLGSIWLTNLKAGLAWRISPDSL
jgi:DNA-binding beta-propeller fold protein YncE